MKTKMCKRCEAIFKTSDEEVVLCRKCQSALDWEKRTATNWGRRKK